MRILPALALLFICSTSALAQKDKFPLTAKVMSSGEETAPETGGVTTAATSPQVRAQFPNVPATRAVRVRPTTYIATKAEIGDKIYVLRGGRLIDPNNYPASIEGRTVRLLTKDKHGKPKILKFYVASVAAKQ